MGLLWRLCETGNRGILYRRLHVFWQCGRLDRTIHGNGIIWGKVFSGLLLLSVLSEITDSQAMWTRNMAPALIDNPLRGTGPWGLG